MRRKRKRATPLRAPCTNRESARRARSGAPRADLPCVADGARPIGEQRGRGCALTLGHRTDLLGHEYGESKEKLAPAHPEPMPLTDHNPSDRHRIELPLVGEDVLTSGQVASLNSALSRASTSYVIGP